MRDGSSVQDFPKEWPQAYALRLVCLYAEWNKPAEQAQWHAELNRVGGTSKSQLASSGLGNLQASRFRATEVLLRDCLAIREKKQPDHWTTFDTKSMLGGELLARRNTPRPNRWLATKG